MVRREWGRRAAPSGCAARGRQESVAAAPAAGGGATRLPPLLLASPVLRAPWVAELTPGRPPTAPLLTGCTGQGPGDRSCRTLSAGSSRWCCRAAQGSSLDCPANSSLVQDEGPRRAHLPAFFRPIGLKTLAKLLDSSGPDLDSLPSRFEGARTRSELRSRAGGESVKTWSGPGCSR